MDMEIDLPKELMTRVKHIAKKDKLSVNQVLLNAIHCFSEEHARKK